MVKCIIVQSTVVALRWKAKSLSEYLLWVWCWRGTWS